MSAYKQKPDPLHDGSIGSYVSRFIMCFILGLFADLIIAGALSYGGRHHAARAAFTLWPLWIAIPLVSGVAGIFAFDYVVKVLDGLNKPDV